MNFLSRLNQNKTFKLILVFIVVFFSLLIYFNKPQAATCVCSNWTNCTWDTDPYGNQYNKQCKCSDTSYDICLREGGTTPICGTAEYVCNRTGGCCPFVYPTPTPDPLNPPGVGCTDTSWNTCTDTCGGGAQFSNCGSQRSCNTQACPTTCNESCTTNAQCTSLNPLWTCDGTSNKCRLASNPTSTSCTACVPSCGGLVCGSTSVAPNQVTNVRVNGETAGNINLTSGSNLNITWNDPGVSDLNSTINYYVIEIWNKSEGTTPPGTCNASSNCVRYQTVGKVENYTAPANPDHDNDIYVVVRAVNDSCVSVGWGAWSTNSSYNLVANVGGNFYNDPSGSPDAFNNCSSSSTTAVDLSARTGTTITTSIGGTPAAIANSYSIADVPYAPTSSWGDFGFDIILSIDNSVDPSTSITCNCPVDGLDPFTCRHTTSASPTTSEHIYLVDFNLSNDSWWQSSGGNVFGESSLTSSIPDTCAEDISCDAYVITQNSDSDAKSAGFPITQSSAISSNGYFTQRSGTEPRSTDANHNNLIKEDYSFFNREIDLAGANTVSGTITTLPSGATPNTDGTEIYYSNGDLTVDITSTQNVISGRKIILFVNGNVVFSSNPDVTMITVTEGGFIGFISNGNITFDASVGNSVATDISSNIAGVFVADGTIRVEGYSDAPFNDDSLRDNKFVGEGTFVGWSGFSLSRNYDNTTNPLEKILNNLNPIEVFNFRPDFNLYIPSILMRPSIVWQEVN